ncbi:Transmembrane channel-like protein 3 [Lamellibrachia satsuma]|nr:Transmembrane channel-like protein 3 [Lamellibrachia satsuma]
MSFECLHNNVCHGHNDNVVICLAVHNDSSVCCSEDPDVSAELDVLEEEPGNIRLQPWPIRRKLNTHRIMKEHLRIHDKTLTGRQEYREVMFKMWRRLKSEISNIAAFFTPWEMRIKIIESHFGTVVASYFTFLRWILWLNIVLAAMTISFIVLPHILVSLTPGYEEENKMTDAEKRTAKNLKTLWDFEGYLKHSVLFYGHYDSAGRYSHGAPAYFLTAVAIFVVSYIIILRRMAINSRQSGSMSVDSAYAFCWKLFASWDYMIGDPDTSRTKSAEIATQLRECIMEEQERKRKIKKMLVLKRLFANVLVVGILSSSAYAIFVVVERSLNFEKRMRAGEQVSWVEQNEVSIVTSLMTALAPSLFDFIGMMEKYHPRVYLRWQLARIFVLYLLNLYTLLIALNSKIQSEISEMDQLRQNNTSCGNSNQTFTFDGVTQSMTNCSSATATSGGDQHVICWETMIGQEFFKLMVFDLLVTVATILVIDFFRGLFVRRFYPCWFWDLERKFPEYGEFKVAENLLYLMNNQAMVWLGTFFSPGLPVFNVFKLVVLMYVRSWAVIVCNIPPEGVFRASRSNNFFYALLILMLFLVTIPILYIILQLQPSSDCGPFRWVNRMWTLQVSPLTVDRSGGLTVCGPSGESACFVSSLTVAVQVSSLTVDRSVESTDCGPFIDYERSYEILMATIKKYLPNWLVVILDYISSAGVIIPVFILLVISSYYLFVLSKSLNRANADLMAALRYEMTEGKKKIYAMVVYFPVIDQSVAAYSKTGMCRTLKSTTSI